MPFRMPWHKPKPEVRLMPKVPAGYYENVWERKRLPGPGAMNYAFESLALAQFTSIGPTIRTRQPIQPMAQIPVLADQMAIIAGLPTVSGQLVKAPLFDPNVGGYAKPIMETLYNDPFPHMEIAPAGAGTL